MSSEISNKLINEYGLDDAKVIVDEFFEYINELEDEDEFRDALTSLFNKGYLVGFKNALIESIEENIQTLDFIQGRRTF